MPHAARSAGSRESGLGGAGQGQLAYLRQLNFVARSARVKVDMTNPDANPLRDMVSAALAVRLLLPPRSPALPLPSSLNLRSVSKRAKLN